MRVLIVDDHDDGRLLLQKIIVVGGHEAVTAVNGREALDTARENPPDVILSDILMPEMDGFQLCRAVRASRRLKETPFLFVTATYLADRDEELALALGADGFIRKPLDPETFLDALERVVRQRLGPRPVPPARGLEDEPELLRRYSERLILRLEQKAQDLEGEVDRRRQTESDLKAMLGAIPDMILRVDRRGRFMEFKPARFFAPCVPADRFLGKSAAEVLPAELAHRALENVNRALDDQGLVVSEYALPVEGRVRDYEARFAPAGREEVVVIIRDITEAKRLERDIASARKDWEDIFQAVGQPTMILAPDQTILAVNRSMIEASGKGAEELIGRFCYHVSHGPQVQGPPPGCPCARLLDERTPCTTEMEVETLGGRYLITCTPVCDANGKLAKIIHIATDITYLHQLQVSQARLAAAMEQTLEGIAVTDPDGVIRYANPSFAGFAGKPVETLCGRGVLDVLSLTGSAAPVAAELRATLEGRKSWDGRLTARVADGRDLHLGGTLSPVHGGTGALTGFVLILNDVSRSVSLEQQVRQAQKMESIGRLAGGVAHDFNNMLGVISGYAELALLKLNSADPLVEDLEEIRTAARRSADLTRQLLAFARRQTIMPKVMDLNELIGGSEKMLRRLVGEDIALEFAPGPDLRRVKMDPSQVDQVLANLAVNSRDAITGVGRMAVATGNVVLDEEFCRRHRGAAPGEYVRLSFSDTGCGMDRETLAQVFEPFFTTKGEGRGTGLGLSTVYGIVKQNQGFINLNSEPGMGTHIDIYLPRAEGKAAVAAPAASAASPKGSETVLVVEDEEMILKLCKTVLAAQGYRVLVAASPEEAILMAERHPEPIHLIITDVVMPAMNGRDLIERVKRHRPGIRSIYMSGYTADVIAHRGVLAEGLRFIQKPFAPGALARRVREALDGR
jgi:PAS domain S-box-containing protein